MQIKPLYLLGIIVLAAAAGRFTAPAKVKIEKEIVEVESKSSKTNTDTKSKVDKNKHKEVLITEITRPDGTKEKVTKVVQDSSHVKNKTSNSSSEEESLKTTSQKETKEVEYKKEQVLVSLLVGTDISNGFSVVPIYGIHIQKRFLGPIYLGGFGMTDKKVGLTLGLGL